MRVPIKVSHIWCDIPSHQEERATASQYVFELFSCSSKHILCESRVLTWASQRAQCETSACRFTRCSESWRLLRDHDHVRTSRSSSWRHRKAKSGQLLKPWCHMLGKCYRMNENKKKKRGRKLQKISFQQNKDHLCATHKYGNDSKHLHHRNWIIL